MDRETESAIAGAVRATFGYDRLRPLQAEAIACGVAGRDALTVLPTGGGKSLCYQVPPLVTGKATVVVSPLIALMRDQVRGLELSGYPAAALHSGVDAGEAASIRDRLIGGDLKLVLAAPERVVTGQFLMMLGRMADAGRLGAVAVDEAHCISQWGHDFRPEYRRLREVRGVCRGVAVQAFTATATPRVREDIVGQLGLVEPEVYVGTFDRPNLTYRVRGRRSGTGGAAEQIAEAIRSAHARHGGGGAIVYAISRRETEELAEALRAMGIDAGHYHAGMDAGERHATEERFTNETLDVVVATVAFGMGIDRSNVRLVVHAALPKSVEAYQQETGRAGRDGEPAECLLLYAPSDATRWAGLIERSAAETGDGEAVAAQLELLRQVRGVASAGVCRHKMLSEHFGQAYEQDNCGACDVCLGETEIEADSERVSRVLLSAVARTGQRFGAGHIADVVLGKSTDKAEMAGHTGLGVFGMLSNRRKPEIQSFLDQLVALGALEPEAGDFQGRRYETLRFGPRGMAVMKGEETVSLARMLGVGTKVSERRRGKGATGAPVVLDAEERDLFEKLRGVRKDLAEELGVPPYVVFNDATLRELVRVKPRDRSAMLEVKGVGAKKLEAFGAVFLEALAGD